MNQIAQTLTSLEVAEMVEKEHKNLKRDIDRYCKQINEANLGLVNELKIELVDFFKESTYTDSKGEKRPCYNITKKGCEFIAHKMTGTKGTVFTARYINKFHNMEQAITGEQLKIEPFEQLVLPRNTSKTWFQRNNWKIKVICESFDWERKFLYHKILSELSDIYNLGAIEEMYKEKFGSYPKFKMDLLDQFCSLQRIAGKYLDYLLEEAEEWK